MPFDLPFISVETAGNGNPSETDCDNVVALGITVYLVSISTFNTVHASLSILV